MVNRSCLHSASTAQIYRSARIGNIAIKYDTIILKCRDKYRNYDNRDSTNLVSRCMPNMNFQPQLVSGTAAGGYKTGPRPQVKGHAKG